MKLTTMTEDEVLSVLNEGLTARRDHINERIAELRRMLGRQMASDVTTNVTPPRRPISAAARRKMAASQKRRWELHRKQQRHAAA